MKTRTAINTLASWSRAISGNLLQVVKFGYRHFDWKNLLPTPALANTHNYVFPTLTVGP